MPMILPNRRSAALIGLQSPAVRLSSRSDATTRRLRDWWLARVEQESNGTFSAWVASLPGVYAAADTAAAAKRGIRTALAAHLDTLRARGREPQPRADVTVLRARQVRY